MARPLPKYPDDLAGFAGILRQQLAWSQRKVAAYFHLHHATIARYENDGIKPPLGYLACLARLVLAQRGETVALQLVADQQFLLREMNKAVRHDYLDEPTFQSWEELCAIADDYLDSRQGKSKPPASLSVQTWQHPAGAGVTIIIQQADFCARMNLTEWLGIRQFVVSGQKE